MKEYKMKLLPKYFDYIKYGTKRIELRLNDEKRNLLNIGDSITFVNLETLEELKTNITNIYKYSSFKELVKNFDIEKLADKRTSKEELLDTLNNIYSKEKQDKYGVVGIEIELLDN